MSPTLRIYLIESQKKGGKKIGSTKFTL